jgi:hypothetical protein
MVGDNSDKQTLEEARTPAIKSPKPRRLVPVVVIIFLLGLAFLICVVSILQKIGAADLFRQYVLNPIPESVSHIKVDQPKTHGGYGYVFRFNVNRKDFNCIRESRPFRETENIRYIGGTELSFDWKGWEIETSGERVRGFGFEMYALVRKPSWYDLASWENPEAYALNEVDKSNNRDVQVLLYNNELEQAYFITFHYSGRGL